MSRKEGKQILKDAEAAGEKYVQEQLSGDYFNQWVWEQMVEADRMRKEDPSSVIPLKSKSDFRKLARNMLQQLSWDTKRELGVHDILDLSGTAGVFSIGSEAWVQTKYGVTASDVMDAFYVGFNRSLDAPATRDWLADELIEPMLRELQSEQKSETREPRQRPRIVIGSILQEWIPDEGEPDPMQAYVQVAATLDGKPITLGVVVGVPDWQKEQARQSGGHLDPFVTAWWADASDHQDVPASQVKAVESALIGASRRLFDSALSMRSEGETRKPRRRAQTSQARSTRQVVRDYIAVDPGGRPVAGPFRDYSQAKQAADRVHGYVKFATVPPREATRRRRPAPASSRSVSRGRLVARRSRPR
jgi:hypothetical protein